MKLTVRLYNNGLMVANFRRSSVSRVLRQAQLKKWSRAYIKVTYGYLIDYFGKRSLFINEGTYTKMKDFRLALTAFTEK